MSYLVAISGSALKSGTKLESQEVISTISDYLLTFLPAGPLSRDIRHMMLKLVFKIKTDPRLPGEKLL